MKQIVARSFSKVCDYAKVRPKEAGWSIVGVAFGVIAGLTIGGVGIATSGGATGLSKLAVVLILAAIGGLIGNRVGIWIEQPMERKAHMTDPIPLTIDTELTDEAGHKRWTGKVGDSSLKAIDTALAKEYAESLILQHDMRTSLAAMNLWKEKFASQEAPEESLLAQSLFRDAIVQFVGCFDKTAQFPLLAEEVYKDNADGLSLFAWFKDVRDAFASHKFGAFRQCVVGVVESGGQRGLGQIMAVYSGQSKEDGEILLAFMNVAAIHLDDRVTRLRTALMEYVGLLKMEEIAKLPDASARTLKMPEARYTRADLRRSSPAPKR